MLLCKLVSDLFVFSLTFSQHAAFTGSLEDYFRGQVDDAGFAGKEGEVYEDREKGRSDSISISDLPNNIDLDALSSDSE
jgi:hypothetical protein